MECTIERLDFELTSIINKTFLSKLLLRSKLLLLRKLLLGSKLLLLLRSKLLLLLRGKLLLRSLSLLSLCKQLVELSLSQLRSLGRLSSRMGESDDCINRLAKKDE